MGHPVQDPWRKLHERNPWMSVAGEPLEGTPFWTLWWEPPCKGHPGTDHLNGSHWFENPEGDTIGDTSFRPLDGTPWSKPSGGAPLLGTKWGNHVMEPRGWTSYMGPPGLSSRMGALKWENQGGTPLVSP
jgi:hypothetical protein